MIASHVQQLESRLPRIGVIRKGAPKGERGPGRDLDHFRLDRSDKSVVEVWDSVLGQEPQAISGVLPYADPAENLSIWDELWQGKRLLWRGDGERLHVQLQGNAYVRYAPGAGPVQPAAAGQKVDSGKVARISRLRLILPQLRVAGIFEIASTSQIDADELWSNLMWIRQTVPTLQGAPVTVFRAARQFNVTQPNGGTMAITKYMLHMMLDGRYLESLLPVAGVLPAGAPSVLPSLPTGIDTDVDDGLFDDDDSTPVTTSAKSPSVQPVVIQQVATNPGRDDAEREIYETASSAFLDTTAALVGSTTEAVKTRLRVMGYTGIPGDAAKRLEAFRKLRAQYPAAGDGDLFGETPVDATAQPAMSGAYSD